MKKPQWLEKEKLYSIMFESERPAGRIFDSSRSVLPDVSSTSR